MLKKFFLNFLSSFAGAWVALVLFVVCGVIVVISLIGKASLSSAESVSVTKHSILKISLDGTLSERETPGEPDVMQLMQGNIEKEQTLDVLTEAIREAKENKNIEMIYLDCKSLSAAPATLHALREELADFRKGGKKIYAFADEYTLGTYYVASVADSIFVNPVGSVAIQGIGGGSLFFKNFFDKVGIKFEVVKVGTYKSAVEPFISDHMSEPARAQLDTLYGGIWSFIRNEIAERRGIKAAQIDTLVSRDMLFLQDGKYAVKAKLADKAVYTREIKGILADAVGVDKDDLNFVSPDDIVAQTDWASQYGAKKQLAVLYATGEIAEGSKTGINCENLVPVITKLAEDDKVKGLVLRVNSPGGSVFGSEQIGEALEYFKSKGKPLAVSMGDYAASGGYWISCGADRIFADPLTVTGSIGIFGLFPNIEGLAQKLGINFETVETNPGAVFPTLYRRFTPTQQAAAQEFINKGYDKFINRVATGRKMSDAAVRRIAEGRVWGAQTAVKIGLVDELGGLEDACGWVRKKCDDGEKLTVVAYPEINADFWSMIKKSANADVVAVVTKQIMQMAPSESFGIVASQFVRQNPVQTRMPYIFITLN